jgi:hypothetical protein
MEDHSGEMELDAGEVQLEFEVKGLINLVALEGPHFKLKPFQMKNKELGRFSELDYPLCIHSLAR